MTITNRPPMRDTGYSGQIKSLSGVVGAPGRGLVINNIEINSEPASVIPVGSNNQKRVWMTIQNVGSTNLQVVFGTDPTYINVIKIPPWSVFQISRDFPWIGTIALYDPVEINAFVTEAQLDG